MRLFLAINLPEELKKKLFELGRPLASMGDVKPVEEENIHLTLKFLGEAEPGDVMPLLEKIKFVAFEVSLKGLGAFPNPNRARVVWVGCEKGAQEIAALHKVIEAALSRFEKDRDFHPHATLARVRFLGDKGVMADFLNKNKILEFGSFKAASFDLMKSELERSGPKYGVVKSFSLV